MKNMKYSIVMEQFDEIGILNSTVVAKFLALGDCYICLNSLIEANKAAISYRYKVERIQKKVK